jgi:hypothetical protein
MNADVDRYRTHSRWSDPGPFAAQLRAIPPEPREVRRAVSNLLVHPWVAPLRGIVAPDYAATDQQLRAVEGAPAGSVAERVYRDQPWLRVTPRLVSFAGGAPVEVASGVPA